MHLVEFALLAIVCTVVPCKSKDVKQLNPFTYQHHFPEFTKIAEYQYDNGRKIAVYEMRKNGAHCGYEFRFEGFPPKSCIVCGDVPQLVFDQDSYQTKGGDTLCVRALFKNCLRPDKSFEAAFHLWGDRIYHITVPVEERIHPHARE